MTKILLKHFQGVKLYYYVICYMQSWKLRFSWKIGENSGFCQKKFWTSEFHQIILCLNRREMVILAYFVSGNSKSFKYIFQRGDVSLKKRIWMATTLLTSQFWWRTLPHLILCLRFFHQNECKRREGHLKARSQFFVFIQQNKQTNKT